MAKDSLKTLEQEPNLAERPDREPRWPAFIAILAVGGLYTGLPEALTIGPHWLFLALVLALSIPGLVFHHTGRHRLNSVFGFTVDGLLTVWLMVSVILLIARSAHQESNATTTLALSSIALDHKYFSFCFVVLAIGRRGTVSTG